MAGSQTVRLSQRRILDAARGVVERDGLEALNMRRLAQELDVWPMSVYRHFRDKDELLDALAASAVEDVAVPDPNASWREQMTALLHQVHSAMGAGTGSRLPRAFFVTGVLRLSELGLAILSRGGFSRKEAAGAWRTLWTYTFGFATFALAPTSQDARRRTLSALAALSEDEYPLLTSSADDVAIAFADDEEFERGLERLFDGLEAAIGRGDPKGAARTSPQTAGR